MPDDNPSAAPPDQDPVHPVPAPARTKSEQLEREGAALRANLRRRKQQIQARIAARDKRVTGSNDGGADT